MNLQQFITHMDPQIVRDWIEKFWIVPVGMVTLYFYGRAHFNTPDYPLGAHGAGTRNLLTLAPPIFTTYRSQFNRFALWYILILETAFVAFIFLTSVFSDIAAIMKFQFPALSSDVVQFRALLALFTLTGLLSSFPGFKDLDSFILRKLHHAALIPDDARLLATQLFEMPFVPHPEAVTVVKASLVSRDTLRVAEGHASGSFESKVLKALCLLNQLQHKIANSKYNRFKLALEKDLNDIVSKREVLRPAFMAYFKEQASIIPELVTDIDQYLLENAADPRVAQLVEKRNENSEKCDDFLYRMCLVVALLAYATKFTPEGVGDTLRDLGFNVQVQARGIMDWDAVFRVTGSVFVIMLGFNALFALLVYVGTISAPAVPPSRQSTLGFSVVTTLFYFLVLMFAIKLKRYWHRDPEVYRYRPENVLVGMYCYLGTLPFVIIVSLFIRGELSYAPLLFALNQGVVGYFIAVYIDRSLDDRPLDRSLAGRQGLTQAITAIGTFWLAPPLPGVDISINAQLMISVFFALESGVAGFLIGYLFQQFYRQTRRVSGTAIGDIALQAGPAQLLDRALVKS
jgi:hypothetical protein